MMTLRRRSCLWLPALAALVLSWSHTGAGELAKLVSTTEPESAAFGSSIDIDGGRLLVSGRRSGYLYEREDGAWADPTIVRIGFRPNVCLDGDRFLVNRIGSARLGVLGIAELYSFDGDTWNLEEEFAPDDTAKTIHFGGSAALSGDHVAVLDREVKALYFFHHEGGAWEHEDTYASLLSPWSVALDGELAIVGAPESNAAIILRRSSSGAWEPEAELRRSNGGRIFGSPVVIQDDVALVGGAADFTGPENSWGRVAVFRRSLESGEWVEEAILAPAPLLPPSEKFGRALALEGDVILAGAFGDSRWEGGRGTGAVYVFGKGPEGWTQIQTITSPEQHRDDWFGSSLALEGSTVAIGASGDGTVGRSTGAVYTGFLGPSALFSVEVDVSRSHRLRVFDGSPSSPAASGHEIVSYRWDFGDGATAEGETATHTYERAGRYRVTLEVVDSEGASGTSSRMVHVQCPAVDPQDIEPWSIEAVGDVLAGVTITDEGCWSLCAGGDIAIRTPGLAPAFNDHFNYVEQKVEGDFTVAMRVAEIGPRDGAQVGLMVRTSLETGTPFVAMTVAYEDGEHAFLFRARHTPEAEDDRTSAPTSLPAWVRIERLGDEVIGFTSADGESWHAIARATMPLGEGAVHVGIAASGADRDPEEPFTAPGIVVCELTARGTAFAAEGPTFVRGDCNGDGAVDISDSVYALNNLFGSGPNRPCREACDSNGDSAYDISDAVFELNFLFGTGLPPVDPGPESCGPDPDPDGSLGCERPPGRCQQE